MNEGTQMQTLQLSRFGAPTDVVELAEVDAADPGPGQLAVSIEAAPINPSDLNLIRGVYGVRPEHLAIAANGAAGVPAVVHVVEPTGADTFVYTTLAGTQVCAVFTERHDFRAGEGIQLQPQLDVVHLFDAASGRKLD